MADRPILYTPHQVGLRTGISRRSVMRAINSGQLPAVRSDRGHWQVRRDDMLAWSGRTPTEAAKAVFEVMGASNLAQSSAQSEIEALCRVIERQQDELQAVRAAAAATAEDLLAAKLRITELEARVTADAAWREAWQNREDERGKSGWFGRIR